MVVAGADSVLLYGNRAARECLGIMDEPSYVGLPFSELARRHTWRDFRPDGTPIDPNDLPIARALRGETTRNEEMYVIRKDGTRRWERVSGGPVYDENGRLVAGLIAFEDVTEQKAAEHALRRRHELEHLIGTFSTRFLTQGLDDPDAGVNEALAAMGTFANADRSYLFIFRPGGVVADNTHEWCAEGIVSMRPELQGLRMADFPMVAERLRASEAVSVPRVADMPEVFALERAEYQRQGIKSLLIVPIELRTVVVGFLGFDAVRREVTWDADAASLLRIAGELIASVLDRRRTEEALRASEERYRVVSAVSGQLLYEYRVDTGAIEWAGLIEEITGYGLEEFQRLGIAGWEEMIHPEDRPEAVRLLQESMRERAPYRAEYRFRRKNGAYLFVEDRGLFFYDERGNAVRMVGSLKDDTDRRKAQQDRARLHEQLQQARRMEAMGRLAGGIAHDFNNLLTTILGNVDLARSYLGSSGEAARSVDAIGKAGASAASLTSQLLAFSRRQIIEPKAIDLNELVGGLREMLSRLLGENIILQIALAEPLGTVKVDPSQFEQVLVNLAVNARDAMPGGGTVRIGTSQVVLDQDYCLRHPYVKPGSYVVLSVSDTGQGMSEEVKKHLFEPFFTTKPVGRGTGLGLATIFGVVKQAGGVIEVDSRLNHGTTFVIQLPRVDEPSQRLERPAAAHAPPTGYETVLLVEDEESVRELAVRTLERLGYTVLTAAEGVEAARIATEHAGRIDLLMTDVVMPGISGRELAERLLAAHSEMRVLFTSGYTEDVIVRHGVAQENINFLAKPYTLRSLADKIRDVLTPQPPSSCTRTQA